ncbi:MAG TPA: DUF1501 domain-containing protein [Mycobacteriales bacterium]
MDTMTRRRFLKASGVAGAGALLAGSGAFGVHELFAAAQSRPLPAGTGVLVVVTLYGGNDGLSMLVPIDDPAYHDARGDLALQASETIPLSEGLALNGVMKGLAAQWRAGHLAIVRGVSYPDPQQSHFVSMDIWQTASPGSPSGTGWVGRWLDVEERASGHDPIRAVSLGPTMPPFMAGATTSAAAVAPGPIRLPAGVLGRAYTALNVSRPDQPQAGVALSGADLAAVASQLGPTLAGVTPSDASTNDAGALGPQLDLVARCIHAGVPTRVYGVDLGGFDTHADEKATQTALLGKLDSGLGTFLASVATAAHPVTVLVYSEFGRRTHANASGGTDHGTSAPVLVAGTRVRGGFYGDEPSLTHLIMGNLAVTTDFRDVYAGVLTGVLGADPEPVLGKSFSGLPLLA